MRTIRRIAFFPLLPFIAGCIAVLPVGEFVPATTDGKVVNTSTHCLGSKNVGYNFDGVPMTVFLRPSGPSSDPLQLKIILSLAEGRVARIPSPEIRIKPLDDGPEEVRLLPLWKRTVLRLLPPRNKQLQDVTVETGPATGPLVGGKPNEENHFGYRPASKVFTVTVPLSDLPSGYRIQLPAIEIDGKLHTVAPIEYRHQVRLEFMVPLNC